MTTQTIRNGTSIEVVIPTGQTLKVVAVSGTYNASVVRGTGIGTTLSTLATGASYGPYAYDSVVRLVSSDASEIDFDVAVTPVVDSDTEPKFAFDSTGAVTGLVGPGGVKYPVNNRNTLGANAASTVLTDYTTGSLAYNGGAASDSTQMFMGAATQRIPHNASAGTSRFDWTHPTSWVAGYMYGFWYRNAGANTLQVSVLAATSGAFSTYSITNVALPPTNGGWKLVTFGQAEAALQGGATLGSSAFTVMRIRESMEAPWGASDAVNIGPIFNGFPSRAVAMVHFDDCNRNVYTNGLPILRDYNIPATVNVITSLIGSTYAGQATFTLDDLKDVYNNYGWDVCSHTMTHPQVQSAGIAAASVVDNLDNTATVTVTLDGNNYPGHNLPTTTTNPAGVQVVMSGFTPANFNNGAAVATIISPTQFKYAITSGSGPVTVAGTWNPAYSNHGLRKLGSYAEKYAEIKGAQDYLLAAGFTRSAKFLAYPQGGYDVDTLAACKAAGVLLARGVDQNIFWPAGLPTGVSYSYGITLTNANLPYIPPYQAGIDVPAAQAIDTSQTFAQIKAEIDRAVSLGAVWVGLTHYITGTRGTAGNNAYQLEQVCQYLNHLRSQGLIDVCTMSDYYNRLQSQNRY